MERAYKPKLASFASENGEKISEKISVCAGVSIDTVSYSVTVEIEKPNYCFIESKQHANVLSIIINTTMCHVIQRTQLYIFVLIKATLWLVIRTLNSLLSRIRHVLMNIAPGRVEALRGQIQDGGL